MFSMEQEFFKTLEDKTLSILYSMSQEGNPLTFMMNMGKALSDNNTCGFVSNDIIGKVFNADVSIFVFYVSKAKIITFCIDQAESSDVENRVCFGILFSTDMDTLQWKLAELNVLVKNMSDFVRVDTSGLDPKLRN